MLLIRRIIGGQYGTSQMSYVRLGFSRRWLCQSSILLNKSDNGSTTSNTNSVSQGVKENIKNGKKQAKTLDDIIKIETNEASESNKSRSRKLSPLEFMNQGRAKIPNNWRKDEYMPEWKRQKYALNEKFKGGAWNPAKRLSRDEMESVKMLKREIPDMTTQDLATHFKISPEAVRRILKSNWKPSLEEEEEMFDRWKKRGEKVKKLYNEKYGTTKRVILKEGNNRMKVHIQKFKNGPAATKSENGTRKNAWKAKNGQNQHNKKKRFEDMVF